jgi:L-aspartate semialdehyde sulfurtransferase ferredoxin
MAERRVRLIFPPELTREPLVYRMGHEFNVVTNIRMVDIDQNVGFVVLGLEGEEDEIDRAIAWAREQGLRVDDATLGDVVEG